MALRRAAGTALSRPPGPAGPPGRGQRCPGPAPVPPPEGPPRAPRLADQGPRARRPGCLPADDHVRRGVGAPERDRRRGAADQLRRRPSRTRSRPDGSAGTGLRHDPCRLRRVRPGPQTPAARRLLPLATHETRPAHGRGGAHRGQVELRPRQPPAAAEGRTPRPGRALAGDRGRPRRRGARGPRPDGPRRQGGVRGAGRSAVVGELARRRPQRSRHLRTDPARGLRAHRGRDAVGRPVDGALDAVPPR